MQFPIRRLVFLGGGAAIFATAGFAYMASNTVSPSSAGEGSGAVTGYHVSNIQYLVDCSSMAPTGTCTGSGDGADYYDGGAGGGAQNLNGAISGVKFTLTSNATSAPANGAPTNVSVYPEDQSGHTEWGHDNGCHIVGTWSAPASSAGSGTVSCAFSPQVPANLLYFLDVEANQ